MKTMKLVAVAAMVAGLLALAAVPKAKAGDDRVAATPTFQVLATGTATVAVSGTIPVNAHSWTVTVVSGTGAQMGGAGPLAPGFTYSDKNSLKTALVVSSGTTAGSVVFLGYDQ